MQSVGAQGGLAPDRILTTIAALVQRRIEYPKFVFYPHCKKKECKSIFMDENMLQLYSFINQYFCKIMHHYALKCKRRVIFPPFSSIGIGRIYQTSQPKKKYLENIAVVCMRRSSQGSASGSHCGAGSPSLGCRSGMYRNWNWNFSPRNSSPFPKRQNKDPSWPTPQTHPKNQSGL